MTHRRRTTGRTTINSTIGRTQTTQMSTTSSSTTSQTTMSSTPLTTKEPKMPKFNGKEESLRIESFIIIFERLFTSLSDDEKLLKVISFFEGEAADAYAEDVLSDPNITWDEAKDKLSSRYGHTDISPIVAASRRRLQRQENVKKYFDDKSKLLRKAGISEPNMADLLTEGLPQSYRSHFYGRRFKTIHEWLLLAQDIEADVNNSNTFRPQNRKPNTGRTLTASKSETGNNYGRNQSRQPNRSQQQTHKPPYNCRYCQELGRTEFHWHRECPNKRQVNDNAGAEDCAHTTASDDNNSAVDLND